MQILVPIDLVAYTSWVAAWHFFFPPKRPIHPYDLFEISVSWQVFGIAVPSLWRYISTKRYPYIMYKTLGLLAKINLFFTRYHQAITSVSDITSEKYLKHSARTSSWCSISFPIFRIYNKVPKFNSFLLHITQGSNDFFPLVLATSVSNCQSISWPTSNLPQYLRKLFSGP